MCPDRSVSLELVTRDTRPAFDEISPIAISQGQLGDDHGLLARRVEQINRRPSAARPVHNQSVRFDVLQDRGFRAPVQNRQKHI